MNHIHHGEHEMDEMMDLTPQLVELDSKYSVGHSKTNCMGVSLHLLFRWSNCVMASDVCLLFMYGINLLCFFIASKCSSDLGGCLSTIQ